MPLIFSNSVSRRCASFCRSPLQSCCRQGRRRPCCAAERQRQDEHRRETPRHRRKSRIHQAFTLTATRAATTAQQESGENAAAARIRAALTSSRAWRSRWRSAAARRRSPPCRRAPNRIASTSRVGMRRASASTGALASKARAERRFVEEIDDARQHAARQRDAPDGDESDAHVAGEARRRCAKTICRLVASSPSRSASAAAVSAGPSRDGLARPSAAIRAACTRTRPGPDMTLSVVTRPIRALEMRPQRALLVAYRTEIDVARLRGQRRVATARVDQRADAEAGAGPEDDLGPARRRRASGRSGAPIPWEWREATAPAPRNR